MKYTFDSSSAVNVRHKPASSRKGPTVPNHDSPEEDCLNSGDPDKFGFRWFYKLSCQYRKSGSKSALRLPSQTQTDLHVYGILYTVTKVVANSSSP